MTETTEGMLSDNMMMAWNQKGIELYNRFSACKDNPLVRQMYLDEWGIEFQYVRQWIDFWRQQVQLDSTALDVVQ